MRAGGGKVPKSKGKMKEEMKIKNNNKTRRRACCLCLGLLVSLKEEVFSHTRHVNITTQNSEIIQFSKKSPMMKGIALISTFGLVTAQSDITEVERYVWSNSEVVLGKEEEGGLFCSELVRSSQHFTGVATPYRGRGLSVTSKKGPQ